MGKNEKTPIDINGKPYYYEDMTEKQQLILNHIMDLDRKLAAAKFNVDQLQVGRDAFMNMLTQEIDGMEKQPEAVVEEDPATE